MLNIYYQYNTMGPGKVVENLKKGLRLINEEYQENSTEINNDSKILSLQYNNILNTKHIKQSIIGPNICTLPFDNEIVMRQQYQKILVPSQWVFDLYKKWINPDKIQIWPVGIDTELFTKSPDYSKQNDCLVYFKRRNEEDLNYAIELLKKYKQKYQILKYGKYKEQDFISVMQNSKYSFLIDGCESQGIAVQEMMSSGLPLFVWDLDVWMDRGEEYKSPATSVPYWDEKCGVKISNKDLLFENFELFLNNIKKYKPRKYILENLTLEKQSQEIVNLFKNNE